MKQQLQPLAKPVNQPALKTTVQSKVTSHHQKKSETVILAYIINEGDKVKRRYSYDDNGGGYMGL